MKIDTRVESQIVLCVMLSFDVYLACLVGVCSVVIEQHQPLSHIHTHYHRHVKLSYIYVAFFDDFVSDLFLWRINSFAGGRQTVETRQRINEIEGKYK